MSRLTDKYQSYDHFKGISFDEPVFNSNPTKTGSKLIFGEAVNMNIESDGSVSPTIETGVLPNQKYYKFDFDNTVTPIKHSRLICGTTSTGSAGLLNDVRRLMWDGTPFDRVTGLWIKTPEEGTSNADNGTILAAIRFVYGTSAMINIGVGKTSAGVLSIGIIHSTTEFTTTGPFINYYEGYTDQNNNFVPIEYGKWYFVAVRKSVIETGGAGGVGNTMTGTMEYQHFINGLQVNSIVQTTWTKRSVSAIIFGNNNTLFKYNFGVSSWFIADWSDIQQTGLQEIYKYGAPIQAPVKYYDGTNWQDDISAPKIFHSNQWNDVYANKYDGSQWVPI